MEEWKDITGYKGLYQISNLGRVKKLKFWCNSNKKYLDKETILKPLLHSNNRYQVGLYKNGKCKKVYIDTLVEQEFNNKKTVTTHRYKEYYCSICHKNLKNEMPIRIVIQEYGAGKYKQYHPIEHFDLCKKCYESKRSAKDEMYNVQ